MITSNVIPKLPSGYNIEQSLRFNDDDSAYLSMTPSVAGNRKTWTFSTWVKRCSLSGASQVIFMAGNTINDLTCSLVFNSSNQLFFRTYASSVAISDAVYRDTSSWYHIVLKADSSSTLNNRFVLYVNGEVVANDTSTVWDNWEFLLNSTVTTTIGKESVSWGFQPFDGYLAETHFIDGQALTPDYFGEFDATYGHWKPIKYSGTYGTNGFYLPFDDAGFIGKDNSTTLGSELVTNGDFSAGTTNWSVHNSSSLSIVDERLLVAVNGDYGGVTTQVVVESGKTYVWSFDVERLSISSLECFIASPYTSTSVYSSNGLNTLSFKFTATSNLIDIYFRASSNGITGQFYLDNVSVREIVTQGNDFTATNLSATDIVLDSPTNNFATLNVLDKTKIPSTISEGSLKAVTALVGSNARSTFEFGNSGKYYWEIVPLTGGSQSMLGISISDSQNDYLWFNSNSVFYYGYDGAKYVNSVGSGYGASYTTGDIIGIAVDIDNSTIEFFKNNVSQGVISHTITGLSPSISDGSSVASAEMVLNFGQDSSFAGNKTPQGYTDSNGIGDFYYQPPEGYLALCTNNLEAIPRPYEVYVSPSTENDYFEGTYVGNGSTDGTFIYLGFLATDIVINGTHYDQTSTLFDFNANGIKCRSTTQNANGVTYTIEAWVDVDFKYGNAQ